MSPAAEPPWCAGGGVVSTTAPTTHAASVAPALRPSFIDGAFCDGSGAAVSGLDPLGKPRPIFHEATAAEVERAVACAQRGLGAWSQRPQAERLQILRRYAELTVRDREALAAILADEVGKPLWECREEAAALAAKVEQTAQSAAERQAPRDAEHGSGAAGFRSALRHAPLGVFAVFAPYNLPLHLANGHLVPALLAGNTVVIKSSELAPRASLAQVALLLEAGVPADAVQLLAGARATGEALIASPHIAAVAFTGSTATGRAIHRALGGRTEVLLALEMGGNNPLVVLPGDDAGAFDVETVATLCVLSSLMTSGQRCTSARRLIVPHGALGDALVAAVVARAQALRIGSAYDDPAPFCGPLVTPAAAAAVQAAVARRIAAGALALLPMRQLAFSSAALSPAILDVSTAVPRSGPDAWRGAALPDEEVFGPLLHVLRVADKDEAFAAACATRFGLSAALVGGTADDFEVFRSRVPAGIVNHNRPTNGALSTLPFGGVGWSGNHRPAGATSIDYCAYPVASTQAAAPQIPAALPPGLDTRPPAAVSAP